MPKVLRPIALAAAIAMAFAAPASAAGWLPAVNLSIPSGTSTASTPTVASDAAGESFTTFLDTDGANTRVWASGRAAGTAWSPPLAISDPGQNSSTPVLALSSNGFAAIAWTQNDGTINRILLSRRAPGGGFGAPVILSAAGSNSNFPIVAVDRSGNVQVGWNSTADNVVHTRRFNAASGTFTGTTDLTTAVTPANQLMLALAIVMSPTGTATIVWDLDTDPANGTASLNVQSKTQDVNGNWPVTAVSHSTTASPTESGRPQLAVADDGTVTLVWMEYQTSCFFSCSYTSSIVRQETRSSAGTWSAAQTLSDPALVSDAPTVAMSPAGETTVIWSESIANAVKALTRTTGGAFPVASAATIITPQDRPIISGNFIGIPISSLHITENATGTVATFLRSDGTNNLASAVYRRAGGQWPNAITGLTTLSAPAADADLDLNASLDGLGNAVVVWTRSHVIQGATLDVSPPAFTAVDVPATATAGQSVAMSASVADVWRPYDATPTAWTFGDGASGSGDAVTHVFATPGTFTVTAGTTDAAGNPGALVTRQIVVTSPPVPPLPKTTVSAPKSTITWKSGRLKNSSVTVAGTVTAPASLTITVALHSSRKTAVKETFAAGAGAFARTLKLPATLSPGTYDVTVSGPVVQASSTSFTVAAPASGIVKRTYASGPRKGPSVTTLTHSSELWAHFSFSFLPKKGQKITTQWILPSGKKLAANTRPRTSLVEAQVKDLTGKALPTGRWRCVITVGKTVLASLNVRLK